MTSPNEKVVTEEEKAEETRLHELTQKTDKTVEEEKEIGELKDKRQTRYQKRIGELTWKSKSAEEKARIKEEEAETLRLEVEELKKGKVASTVTVKEEYIEINNKRYLTDEALIAKVSAGQMTDSEAFKYSRVRDREEDRALLRDELNNEKKKESEADVRKKDAEEVLSKYPKWDKNHPDFNPEEPLYKLSTELWAEGYNANPRGLTLAIKRAKEILRTTDTAPDRSDDLHLDSSSPPSSGGKEKEVSLSDDEKEIAERVFCRGDILNPVTKRAYTRDEAYAKALQAKKERARK